MLNVSCGFKHVMRQAETKVLLKGKLFFFKKIKKEKKSFFLNEWNMCKINSPNKDWPIED